MSNRSRVAELLKHYGGPTGKDPHPSGSPQSDHGTQGMLHVPRGKGTLKGKDIGKYICLPDGSELPLSWDALEKAENMMVNGELQSIGSVKGVPRNVIAMDAVLGHMKAAGLNPEDIISNYNRLWTSAMERYAANPELVDLDRFYEQWHEAYSLLSKETGFTVEQLAAAGAVISPGMDAKANLTYIHDIARMMKQNPTFKGESLDKLEEALRAGAQAVFSPVYMEGHVEVQSGDKQKGDPREPISQYTQGGEITAQWAKGQSLLEAADWLATQTKVKLSDLPDDIAARALQFQRSYVGAPAGGILGQIALNPSITAGLNLRSDVGFSVKNYDYYERGISLLRGTLTPDQALGDVKTRSFFNNIMDFTDNARRGDVTVDFHAADSAFFVRGMSDNSTLMGGGKLQGVGIGVRAHVADAIRALVPRAQRTVGKITGERMTPLRVQEILWAEWQRGHVYGGAKNKEIVAWRSFAGEEYKLGEV